MTNEPYVLIISTKADVATDDVVRRLAARGTPFRRLNTEDYPFEQMMDYVPGADERWLTCEGALLPSPTSVWYRRVRTAPTPQNMDEGVAMFCRQETRAALLGSIMSRQTRWMSHPAAIWQAEFKPYQLDLAARIGLRIPRTVITNNPTVIREHFATCRNMVVKPTRTGHLVNCGVEQAIYTSQVLNEHLEDLDAARWSPAIYQELIPKAYDVRVTIVGTTVLAACIDSQSDPAASIDWRQTDNPHLPHNHHELPAPFVAQLLEYMRCLRLAFGAIDLILTSTGEYIFLEVNPSGQWLWLDDILQLGISETVAAWLALSPS